MLARNCAISKKTREIRILKIAKILLFFSLIVQWILQMLVGKRRKNLKILPRPMPNLENHPNLKNIKTIFYWVRGEF